MSYDEILEAEADLAPIGVEVVERRTMGDVSEVRDYLNGLGDVTGWVTYTDCIDTLIEASSALRDDTIPLHCDLMDSKERSYQIRHRSDGEWRLIVFERSRNGHGRRESYLIEGVVGCRAHYDVAWEVQVDSAGQNVLRPARACFAGFTMDGN